MRATPEWTVTCWVNLMQVATLVPYAWYVDEHYTAQFLRLYFLTITMIVLQAVGQIVFQVLRFKALQREKAAAL